MQIRIFFFLLLTGSLLSLLVWQSRQSIQVVKYFPLDKQAFFQRAETSFVFDDKSTSIEWLVQSESSEQAYLRQDVGLVYANGLFKGVKSSWEQHVTTIELQEDIPVNSCTMYQAISFHHGEYHRQDLITSIHTLSDGNFFYCNGSNSSAFRSPNSSAEEKIKNILVTDTKKALQDHYESLLTKLEIDADKYEFIPLTELKNKQQLLAALFPLHNHEKIMSQLWEGLYKNYVIPLVTKETSPKPHKIPLVLLRKDASHLLVLYEWDGKPMQLYQQIN